MNILGQPFSPWVTNQIKTRQTSLGNSTNLTNENLLYQNTRSPWIRLASSVDIILDDNPNSNYNKLLATTTIPAESLQGDLPARNFILQGGASRLIGKEGISSVGLNSGLRGKKGELITPVFSGAYGWGGLEDRGYAPMPGLMDAKVEYYKSGALSKATVNMKCFTRNQLAMMDVLYMRPGYNLLLEFGWSHYLDNLGKLQTFDNFLTPALSYLYDPQPIEGSSATPTHFDVLNLIQQERISRVGNYEGVFGKITNYNWKFNTDGSYDCSVNLTGMGDMIESLKVNIKLPTSLATLDDEVKKDTTTEETPVFPLIANKEETTLNKLLYELYQQVLTPSSTSGDQFQEVSIPQFPFVKAVVDANGKATTTFAANFDLDIDKGLLAIYEVTTDNDENASPQVYLTFGSLLALIQKYLLIYNKNGCPLFSFDVDFENMAEDENYMVAIPGQFSANPLVCLIPYTGILGGMIDGSLGRKGLIPNSPIYQTLLPASPNFHPTGELFVGRMCNIYLNINHIATVLSKTERSEDGSLSLLAFLKAIISSFTEALGGINSIDVKIDEVTQQIKFIENAPQRFSKPQSTGEYARINTFGVKPNKEGSFVRNIDINGSISSNFASMITIGAQASGNTVSENATGFSTYNLGLIDRVIPEKLNAKDFTKVKDDKEDTPKLTIIDLWDKQINDRGEEGSALFDSVYSKKFLVGDCNALTQLNLNFLKLMSGWLVENKHLQSPTFLPFNLTLDIDGMSGMRLYEKFLIDDKVLPPAYGDDQVDLLIKGLNHSVNSADWTTMIDTQSSPKRTMDATSRPAPLRESSTNSRSTNPSNPSSEAGFAPDDYGILRPIVTERAPKRIDLNDEVLRLRLTRIMDDRDQTLGYLEVLSTDGQTVLFTLATSELPWKGNKNEVSCIPTGRYRVASNVSDNHGRCFFLIGQEANDYKYNKLVGGGYTRTAVLIHMFPKAKDWALGCIGPGMKFNNYGNQKGKQQGTGQKYMRPALTQSYQALDLLLDKLYPLGSFKMDIVNKGGVQSSNLPSSWNTQVKAIATAKNLLPNPYTR